MVGLDLNYAKGYEEWGRVVGARSKVKMGCVKVRDWSKSRGEEKALTKITPRPREV